MLFQKNDAISKSRNPNKGSHVKEFQLAFLPDQKGRKAQAAAADGREDTDRQAHGGQGSGHLLH